MRSPITILAGVLGRTLTLSGFVGNSCRHFPTCSEYAYEAIARHGLWAGGWMGFAVVAVRSSLRPTKKGGALRHRPFSCPAKAATAVLLVSVNELREGS